MADCYYTVTLQCTYEMLKANHNFGITINTNVTVQDLNIHNELFSFCCLPLLWKYNNWSKNTLETNTFFFNKSPLGIMTMKIIIITKYTSYLNVKYCLH